MAFQVFNGGLKFFDVVPKASQAQVVPRTQQCANFPRRMIMVYVKSNKVVSLSTHRAAAVLSFIHQIIISKRNSKHLFQTPIAPTFSILLFTVGQRCVFAPVFAGLRRAGKRNATINAVRTQAVRSGAIFIKLASRLRLFALITPGFCCRSALLILLLIFSMHGLCARVFLIRLVVFASTGFTPRHQQMVLGGSVALSESGNRLGDFAFRASFVWYALVSHSLNLLNSLKLWLGRLKSYLGRPSPLYHTTSPSFTVL